MWYNGGWKKALLALAGFVFLMILLLGFQGRRGGSRKAAEPQPTQTPFDWHVEISWQLITQQAPDDPRAEAIEASLRGFLQAAEKPVGLQWVFLLDIVPYGDSEYVLYYYSDTAADPQMFVNSLHYHAVNCARLLEQDGGYSFLPFVRTGGTGFLSWDRTDDSRLRTFAAPDGSGVIFTLRHRLWLSGMTMLNDALSNLPGFSAGSSGQDADRLFRETANDLSIPERFADDGAGFPVPPETYRFNALELTTLNKPEGWPDEWGEPGGVSLTKHLLTWSLSGP